MRKLWIADAWFVGPAISNLSMDEAGPGLASVNGDGELETRGARSWAHAAWKKR
jgi:hypothetical protein